MTAGIAQPVPDARAPVETTIASADELRTALPGTGAGEAPLIVEQPAPVATLPALRQYVYVEELPEPVHSVAPSTRRSPGKRVSAAWWWRTCSSAGMAACSKCGLTSGTAS